MTDYDRGKTLSTFCDFIKPALQPKCYSNHMTTFLQHSVRTRQTWIFNGGSTKTQLFYIKRFRLHILVRRRVKKFKKLVKMYSTF